MTNGPRNPTPAPQAPDTAPGAPTTDGSLPAGVDDIGEGFDGSTVNETVDDGTPSSVQPPKDLPEGATETEKELHDEWYHEDETPDSVESEGQHHTHVFPDLDDEEQEK